MYYFRDFYTKNIIVLLLISVLFFVGVSIIFFFLNRTVSSIHSLISDFELRSLLSGSKKQINRVVQWQPAKRNYQWIEGRASSKQKGRLWLHISSGKRNVLKRTVVVVVILLSENVPKALMIEQKVPY